MENSDVNGLILDSTNTQLDQLLELVYVQRQLTQTQYDDAPAAPPVPPKSLRFQFSTSA